MYIIKNVLIKPKTIFEYFGCFWKYFFVKNFKKSKKFSTLPFGDSIVSREFSRLQSRVYPEWFATHWRVRVLVMKTLRKYFKIWVLDFLATHSRVVSLLRGVRNLLVSRSPSREKDLEKFFKIWVQGILATHSQVS